MSDLIVEVTEDFKAAPEGHTVEHFKKGDMLEGARAEIALKLGCGKKKRAEKKPKKNPKPEKATKVKPDHEG